MNCPLKIFQEPSQQTNNFSQRILSITSQVASKSQGNSSKAFYNLYKISIPRPNKVFPNYQENRFTHYIFK